MAKESYVALHCHSHYSHNDAVGGVEEWVLGAKKKGLAGLALTDHGAAESMLELYEYGKKHDFPVILGTEAYLMMEKTKDSEDKYCHLILWAKNQIGYQNICKLSYISYQDDHFYYKPRITFEDLVAHKEGLVVGSACVAGPIAKYIKNSPVDDYDGVPETHLRQFKEVFGDDFYLEIQHADLTNNWDSTDKKFKFTGKENYQETVNRRYIEHYAPRYDIKIIATPDAHMVNENQKIAQDVQLMNFYKSGAHYYEAYYLPSRQEFIKLFKAKHSYITEEQINEYLDNTYEILEKCKDLKLNFKYNLPEVEEEKLDLMATIRRKGRIDLSDPVYTKRLEEELKVIRENGTIDLAPYFVVLQDIVEWCSANNVMVGPGRGSAAGSLVVFGLGITQVDPIKYGLSFARFLNESRVKRGTLPDIDLDFSNPQVVKDYLMRKYGKEHVCCISVNQTLKARSALKDVLRVLCPNITADEATVLTKSIDHSTDEDQLRVLKDSIRKNQKLREFLFENPEILKTTAKLLGQVRQRGVHAAAVVMSKDPIYHVVPVVKNREQDVFSTQYTMKWCEKAGLIKFDILGLNTLSDISHCLKLIKDRHNKDIDIYQLELNDKKVFRCFEKAETDTVFQFNTPLVKRILSRVKIKSMLDLAAITSIARPGPMGEGMDEVFVRRSSGQEIITFPHAALTDVLKNSYGVMIYQEQVMEAVKVLGGFTDVEADDVRRAMGKKKIELLNEAKGKFINYATSNFKDIDNVKAQQLWDLIYSFGGYGFNLSHALVYSLVAYACMWLKFYYPLEWWAAVLTNEGDSDNILYYFRNNKELFILPDINLGKDHYYIKGDKIVMPLTLLNKVAEKNSASIIENQPYTSLTDFLERSKVNRTVLASLVWSGALDSITPLRDKELLEEAYYTLARKKGGKHEMVRAMEEIDKEIKPLNRFDVINKKAEACPVYDTNYCKIFQEHFDKDLTAFESLEILPQGKKIKLGGLLSSFRKIKTKRGEDMAFIDMVNNGVKLGVTAFPEIFNKHAEQIKNNCLIEVVGKIQVYKEKKSVIADSIKFLDVN